MTPPHADRRWRATGLLLAAALTFASGRSSARDLISDHLAGPAVIIHGSGAANTLNVVILGDGFTSAAESIGAYRDAADHLVAELLATDPFAVLSSALTVYRLDVISDEPGIDVPVDCGGQPYDTGPKPNGDPFEYSRSAKNPNNILDTHWCNVDVVTGAANKQFLGSETDKVATFANEAGVIPHITIVLVNDWMFGATAFAEAAVVFVSISQKLEGDINPDTGKVLEPNDSTSFPIVTVHEFGHMEPFRLLDEYSKGRPAADLAGDELTINESPNLTTVLSPLKWASLMVPGTEVPHKCEEGSNPPEVGAAPGGYGFGDLQPDLGAGKGVFRSRCDCKMKVWRDATLCTVCRQRVLQGLAPHLPSSLLNYEIPRKLPSAVPGKPDPSPMWVILDELAVKSGASGWYSIEYTISIDGPKSDRPQAVSGVWPRDRGVYLQRGQTVAIDDLLTIVPPDWLASSLKLKLDYRLIWRPKFGDSAAGPPTVVAHELQEIPLARLKTGIVALNRPTHRLTLGLVVPQ